MKLLKALAGICSAIALASALSGCVVVPVPIGHGGYYHHDRY
jgi:hypothetical protein